MAAHDVGAVVPVKRLGYALGRLARTLDRPERRVLQSAMLGDVLAALAGSTRLGEIVVVTSDPRAGAVAESVGARTVPDHDPPQGINAAVSRGIDAIDAHSALVLVSDLPLITAADVDHLIAAAPDGDAAVLARSESGTGTNAMLLTPPDALVPQLGPDSLIHHCAQAAALGVPVEVVHHPGIALDVDTPEDLAELVRREPGGATGRALERLGIARGAAGAPG
ncbi:MAG: 2-phospho-L-lactate guanylyltransferase [Actinobacteria bacterium]|nr:2-phospho-L-lactate guanylyltransferase [Actinomycetota bacterium]MBM3697290.1 2-phospho-L-lactate guanylyltransferase [Actinomycetota bacterium]